MAFGKFLACFICVAGAAACGWLARGLVPDAGGKRIASAAAVPSVAIGEVARAVFNPPEEFVAHVEPVQEVDILPQIEGYVTAVRFAEGAQVKAGDVLFEIDAERYAAADSLAAAAIEQAKSRVGEAEAALEKSKRYLARLRAADARGVTRTELDAAETGHAADVASLASAKSAVTQAEANRAVAAFNLKHTVVRAPIDGRIGKSLFHAGDFASPSKGALARIVQTDPVRVSFPITDRAYLEWARTAKVRGGAVASDRRLRLRLADGSVYSATGKWDFTHNEMSAETATVLVRALFPNAQGALLPNAYVTVLADEAAPEPVVTVPSAAVVRTAVATGVWTLDADNRAHFRDVKTGVSAEGSTRIDAGLEPGERIVVQGVHKLGEGCAVRIVPASEFN